VLRSLPSPLALRRLLPVALGLLLTLTATGAPACAQSVRGGGFAAMVNGRPITNFEVDREVEMRMVQLRSRATRPDLEAQQEQIRAAVLDELINERLLLDRCDALDIQVRPEQIDMEVERRISHARLAGDASIGDPADFFDQWEAQFGQNEERAREDIGRTIRIRMLISTIHQDQYLGPAELRAYYRNHPEEFTTPAVHIFRQILLPLADPSSKEKVEEIKAALEAGESFEALVRRYSEGPRRELGGLWELTDEQLDGMLLPLPKLVRETQAGETSPPIATTTYIHVIRVEEHREGSQLEFSECQSEIRSRLRGERRQEAQNRFQSELLRDAEIRIIPREPSQP